MQAPIKTPPSIGKPGGGVKGSGSGTGGGAKESGPCDMHTKLINTNKTEASILLFCKFIIESKCIKKDRI